jgi:hypothetical protein
MPSILLHNKDKRLTQVSVWLNEGCQIISGELLTKVGLQELWSITDGYKVTSFSYHLFILIHNSLYDSHNYWVRRFKDSATYLISGRSLYVKLSFNAVRRSKIHARSWKNTSKIGFCSTWLHSRHQANGGGIPKLHMASCQPGAFSCRILPNFSFCQLDGRLRLLQTDI